MRRLIAAFALALVLAAFPSAAQEKPPAAPEAKVSVFNRPIAIFRAPFLGLAPVERARRTEAGIAELLARGGPGQVAIQPVPQGRMVTIDGAMALVLIPEDADPIRGETLDAISQVALVALARAIEETREARDRRRLLAAAALAAAATAVYLALAWAVLRVRRAASRRIAAWAERKSGGAAVLHPVRVQALLLLLLRLASWVLLAGLTYQWLVYALQLFPRTRAAGEQLGAFVIGVGERIGGGVLQSLPDLAVALAIFLLARVVIGLLAPGFDRAEQGHDGWLDRDLARPTRRIVNLAVWLFAVVMAYPYLPGSDSEAFKGMSVLVGLMITLGGSSLVGQAASGMILMYSRTLRVGEYVRIGESEGTVVELGTFTTRIRTGLGEEITLPNALVMGERVCNYSRATQGRGYVIDTTVTIGYDTPWRQVEALLQEALRRTPGVLADPAPRVLQRALSDFYVEYRAVGQAIPETPRARAEVLHALHANIQDVFNEHGVQIMSPHYLGDPAGAKVVPQDHPYAAAPAGRA